MRISKWILCLAAASTIVLAACSGITTEKITTADDPPRVAADLAYDMSSSTDNIIYITESGEKVPYIVLTADYGGNALLLRKNVDHSYIYNTPGHDYNSYYCESEIDKYLNYEFINEYEKPLRKIIVSSDIEIASQQCIETHEKVCDHLRRKIFLLSVYEINGHIGATSLNEGRVLDYFNQADSRTAYSSEGEPRQYFTRSAALQERDEIFGVDCNGIAGIGGINGPDGPYTGGIRPAFCIPADTPVTYDTSIIGGQGGYIIDFKTD